MTTETCQVFETLEELSDILASARLVHPRCRQRAEDIFRILADISTGAASSDHIPALESLARSLEQEGPDEACREVGSLVLFRLREHGEVFLSHIETHNCLTGDCDLLTPAPCQMACPAGIDVASYVSLIARGRDAEAVELIRMDNPFPWVCGLVCTHPCEFNCVRGRIDAPIAIKDLKAFASDRVIPAGQYANPDKAPDNGRQVCVVGAGPAGLTAAYFLALKGYRVTIFEALPVLGGMLRVGIPDYRLPPEVVDREIDHILRLGIEVQTGKRLGEDFTLDDLRAQGYQGIFLGIGAHRSLKLNIAGEEDFEGVVDAVEFLRNVNLGKRERPGDRVVIIGGGNVAVDAARTALRLGCHQVNVVYRRSREEMPAYKGEIEGALAEGVKIHYLTAPVQILGNDGKVTGCQCIRTELGPADESGRRRPVPVEGSEFVIDCDAVIPAIGQQPEVDWALEEVSLEVSRRNTLAVNPRTMQTGIPDVFAAGDAVTGPATVIEAVAAGKIAAEAMDRYLRGIPEPRMPRVPFRRQRVEWLEVAAATKMSLRRPEMPVLNADSRRTNFKQVELGLTEAMARDEARRCLRCDVCKRCGLCVSICREKMELAALQFGYLDFDHPGPTDYRISADRCILCGACAANCPTGAMVLEDRNGERVLSLCGTLLCRENLEYCEACGAVLGPARYLDHVSKRTQEISRAFQGRLLCADCARRVMWEASLPSLKKPG